MKTKPLLMTELQKIGVKLKDILAYANSKHLPLELAFEKYFKNVRQQGADNE